jgi:hypothetical protein
VLGVPRPAPAAEAAKAGAYHFEYPVTFIHTGTQTRGFIDLYRAGHFVMEAKQGVTGTSADDDREATLPADLPRASRKGHGTRGTRGWDDTMMRARHQADGYARAVSRIDGWPPFLLVVDVGHVIEVYADFSGQGQGYTQGTSEKHAFFGAICQAGATLARSPTDAETARHSRPARCDEEEADAARAVPESDGRVRARGRLLALIAPHYPKAGPKGGRPPMPLEVMLRVCLPRRTGMR